MGQHLVRDSSRFHGQTLLLWKCSLVSLLLVFVVGLRGSLSKLISLQQQAKSRHPDWSVHTNKSRETSSFPYSCCCTSTAFIKGENSVVNRFLVCFSGGFVCDDFK